MTGVKFIERGKTSIVYRAFFENGIVKVIWENKNGATKETSYEERIFNSNIESGKWVLI